jgi:hypothetical protein
MMRALREHPAKVGRALRARQSSIAARTECAPSLIAFAPLVAFVALVPSVRADALTDGKSAAAIYFDHYTRPQYYGAVKSTDPERWQDISAQVSFPRAARHGTVLEVPGSVIRNLQNQEHNQQPKP